MIFSPMLMLFNVVHVVPKRRLLHKGFSYFKVQLEYLNLLVLHIESVGIAHSLQTRNRELYKCNSHFQLRIFSTPPTVYIMRMLSLCTHAHIYTHACS